MDMIPDLRINIFTATKRISVAVILFRRRMEVVTVMEVEVRAVVARGEVGLGVNHQETCLEMATVQTVVSSVCESASVA